MAEQMKPSGIDWIGDVPQKWEITKLKYSTGIIMGQSPDSELIKEDNGKFLFMQGNSEFTDMYPQPTLYCDHPNKISRIGDILMSVRAPVGAMNISDKKYGIGRGLCSISAKKFDRKYLWYFMQKSREDFQFYSNGSTFEAITTENLLNFKTIIPPLSEQKAIAEHLDKQCAQIDSIIEDIEKQIEILQKYKKSLITETVTKGLDKTVLMKDSGIDWIGDVPKSWGIKRIKYISSLKGRIGWQGLTSDEYTDEGPYLITGIDFIDGRIDWENCVHITKERWEEAPEIHIKNGDLLITKDGTVGKVAIVDRLEGKASLNSGVLLIRTIDGFNKRFLFWVLQSEEFWTWFRLKNAGNSTIIHLYQRDFEEFSYTFPSEEEQQQIADFLNEHCSKINNIVLLKQQQLETIKQHKKSLIYEYVTGKKRVKEAL